MLSPRWARAWLPLAASTRELGGMGETSSNDLGLRGSGDRQVCVLVVEDDPALQRMILNYFGENNIRTRVASGRQEMARQLGSTEVNLVILDLRLGQEDGLDLLREIRSSSDVPVIIITGHRRDDIDRVVGLELGADDYVTKPFSMLELLARSETALRRYFVTREVLLDQKPVGLTRKEYRLLHILANHLGLVVTHEQLLKDIWTGPHRENIQYLRILVRKLRQKIETDPDRPRLLITESGVGYRLQRRLEAASGEG